MAIKKFGTLEIEEEAIKSNQLFWIIRRIVFLILFIILILVFLGFTGPGILGSTIESSTKNLFWIEYNKYARSEASTTMKIHVNPLQLTNSSPDISLEVSRNYFNNFYTEQIIPKPTLVKADGQNLIYNFRINSNKEFIIQFLMVPKKIGFINGIFTINANRMRLRQFIYP